LVDLAGKKLSFEDVCEKALQVLQAASMLEKEGKTECS
jgi:hypothetical protein